MAGYVTAVLAFVHAKSGPSEHHYTTQTSKFNNLLNRSSTMLNNVLSNGFVFGGIRGIILVSVHFRIVLFALRGFKYM